MLKVIDNQVIFEMGDIRYVLIQNYAAFVRNKIGLEYHANKDKIYELIDQGCMDSVFRPDGLGNEGMVVPPVDLKELKL